MKKLVLGALVGAGVALLYAPATGRRTRSLIRDKAVKVGNDVSGFVGSKQRHLANKVEGYRAKARSMASRVVDATEPAGVSGEPSI